MGSIASRSKNISKAGASGSSEGKQKAPPKEEGEQQQEIAVQTTEGNPSLTAEQSGGNEPSPAPEEAGSDLKPEDAAAEGGEQAVAHKNKKKHKHREKEQQAADMEGYVEAVVAKVSDFGDNE